MSAADGPPAAKLHDARDIHVALRCRRAVGQDSELARYAVCVTVRQGVAVLWGRLPDERLVRRAVEIVQRVPGVFQVRSEVAVGPVEPDRNETPNLPRPISIPVIRQPSQSTEAISRHEPRSRGVLAGSPRNPKPAHAEAAWLGRPEPRRKSEDDPASAAVLLPPRPAEIKGDVMSAVARLISGDVRFAGIRGEERNGVVTLSGSPANVEQVLDLARQVSRLQGVKEVVVENVHVAPR
jgi:osmotically-inducible protein OsmY